jgi:glycosyltransferase involved in cell wall biosynthesis
MPTKFDVKIEIKSPKISLVIPSFNQGKFIEETIQSIINQDYSNFEIIIIDGGSKDETVDIIKKYQHRIAYWTSERDSGQSEAINKGIARATGDKFNWINSDDYLQPNVLNEIAELYKATNFDALCARSNYVGSNGDFLGINEKNPKYQTKSEDIGFAGINQPGTFFKLSVVKALGGVSELLHYSMDLDLWVRFLLKYNTPKIVSSDIITTNFRLHENSKTVTSRNNNSNKEFLLDTMCIYQQIAYANKNEKLAENLKRAQRIVCDTISNKTIPGDYVTTKKISCQSINIFIYNLARKKYYQSELNQSKELLRLINPLNLPLNIFRDYLYTLRKTLGRSINYRSPKAMT